MHSQRSLLVIKLRQLSKVLTSLLVAACVLKRKEIWSEIQMCIIKPPFSDFLEPLEMNLCHVQTFHGVAVCSICLP